MLFSHEVQWLVAFQVARRQDVLVACLFLLPLLALGHAATLVGPPVLDHNVVDLLVQHAVENFQAKSWLQDEEMSA